MTKKNVSQLYFKSFVCNVHLYLKFCLLYICKIVFGQVYAPGQVTYYDPHCSNMVKWSIIIVWPLPTLHYHTCLPGHIATVDDYKYMDGHTTIIVSDSVSRGTVQGLQFSLHLWSRFYLSENLQTDYHQYLSLVKITVKSMFYLFQHFLIL